MLVRPDSEPDVESHDGSEESPGVNQRPAIAELSEVDEKRHYDGEKDEGNDHAGAKVVGKAALPQRVVDERRDEGHSNHDERAGRPTRS